MIDRFHAHTVSIPTFLDYSLQYSVLSLQAGFESIPRAMNQQAHCNLVFCIAQCYLTFNQLALGTGLKKRHFERGNTAVRSLTAIVNICAIFTPSRDEFDNVRIPWRVLFPAPLSSDRYLQAGSCRVVELLLPLEHYK